jgi:arsenate reductase-like glutaredoxin family protein
MFKNDPERYMDYIAENPYDQGLVDMYNKGVNGDLKKARELANKYRAMPDLTIKERKELLDNIKEQQNLIKRHLIEVFKAYDELN